MSATLSLCRRSRRSRPRDGSAARSARAALVRAPGRGEGPETPGGGDCARSAAVCGIVVSRPPG
eukprot:6291154-Pyramimonas_sp.AAC.1